MKKRLIPILLLTALAGVLSAQNDKYLILEDGNYFNGTTFKPFKELQIKNGKIVAITGQKSKVQGKRIPVNNKYIIPGLIDSHVHFSGSPAYPYTFIDPLLNANSALLCGVTTNMDLFFPEASVKSFKDSVALSPEKYASVLMSGPILTAPGGHGTEYGVPTRTISSVEEAEKITNEVAAKPEIDVIKLVYEAYSNPHSLTKEMVKKIVEVAHKYHKKVFAHIDVAKEAMDCIEVGVDVLAHIPYNLMTETDLKQLKKSGAIVIPTITVYQSCFEGHTEAYMSDSLLWHTAQPGYLQNFQRAALSKPPGMEKYFTEQPAYEENLKNCIKMHIPILAGTDAGNYAVFYGYSLHNELSEYVKGGMSVSEALCTATQNIQLVFPGTTVGKIAPGYNADIVVLNANPLDNIDNTKQIDFVLHQGSTAQKMVVAPTVVEAINYDSTVFNWNSVSATHAFIHAYSDSMMGGSSSSSMSIENGAIHLVGAMHVKGYLGFAGAQITLSKTDNEIPVKLDKYKSIEFDVKGNGESYQIKLISDLIKDYNYHTSSFQTSKDWTTIKIDFSDFKQNPWYGKKKDLDLKTISAIRFEASLKDYIIDLQVKNIRLK